MKYLKLVLVAFDRPMDETTVKAKAKGIAKGRVQGVYGNEDRTQYILHIEDAAPGGHQDGEAAEEVIAAIKTGLSDLAAGGGAPAVRDVPAPPAPAPPGAPEPPAPAPPPPLGGTKVFQIHWCH